MNKEIQEFIEKLKNWKNNFTIQDYDYVKYDCEVADIAKWQREDNISELINFWNGKIREDFFELKHPIYNNITVRAVKNYQLGIHNFILFTDKYCKFFFILGQSLNAVDIFVTPMHINVLVKHAVHFVIENLQYISDDNFYNFDTRWCFFLKQPRPYHFFIDELSNLYQLNVKNIFKDSYFFVPKNISFVDKNKSYVSLYPNTINFHPLIREYKGDIEKYVTIMFNKVLQESLESYDILTDKDNLKQEYDLTIWLGLPGERRAWLGQIEGTANILKHLNKYFNKIKVYIDGMTAYDGERKDFPENKVLFNKIINATRKLFFKEYNKNIIFTFEELQESISDSIVNEERFIVFKSLAGYDYRTKICYCEDCDIAISDSGTTGLIPFKFHQKPGVVFYGDKSWIKFSEWLSLNNYQYCIKEDYILQVNKKSHIIWDYHIPLEHIYNLVVEVLERLDKENKLKVKNIKIHRLDVPPVELVAKQYELEQKLQIDFPMESVALYSELEKKINTLALCNNTTLNQVLENINTNNTLKSISQHSLQGKDQIIQNLENKIKDVEFKLYFKTAKSRIQNQLSYKLGQAMIANSKSILGYIRMPFVLSYIKDKHKQEQKIYQEKIKKDPSLKLPPLESYPDYQEALKEKECLTYKLGQAIIQANKTWYKGGYIKLWFEIKRLKDGI
ncbi:TPA: hypothetical protein ACH5K9_000639 [Campylobacter jejuni]